MCESLPACWETPSARPSTSGSFCRDGWRGKKNPKSYFPLLPTTWPFPRPEGKQRVGKDVEQKELSQRLNFRVGSVAGQLSLSKLLFPHPQNGDSPVRER